MKAETESWESVREPVESGVEAVFSKREARKVKMEVAVQWVREEAIFAALPKETVEQSAACSAASFS